MKSNLCICECAGPPDVDNSCPVHGKNNNRMIPTSLLRRLEDGEATVICEAHHRGGGSRTWHVFTSVEEIVALLEARPMSRLEKRFITYLAEAVISYGL